MTTRLLAQLPGFRFRCAGFRAPAFVAALLTPMVFGCASLDTGPSSTGGSSPTGQGPATSSTTGGAGGQTVGTGGNGAGGTGGGGGSGGAGGGHYTGECFVSGWCVEESRGPGASHAIFQSGPDIWLAANPGLEHWNGSQWSLEDVPQHITDIAGISSDDLWIAAVTLRHWSAGTWTDSGMLGKRLYVAAANDVWSGGVLDGVQPSHWDGTAWSPMGSLSAVGLEVVDVSGSASDNVWMAGSTGFAPYVSHWDGSALSEQPIGIDEGRLRGVWTHGPNDTWVVGSAPILAAPYIGHWDGTSWNEISTQTVCGTMATPCPSEITAVWGSAADDVWIIPATGDCSIWHWNGVSLSADTVCTNPPNGGYLERIQGSSGNDVWALGTSGVFHWNGTSWSEASAPLSPTTASVAPNGLVQIWGSSENDVWAVGPHGAIAHRTGAGWAHVDSGVTFDLVTVHGSGPNDVWAVGKSGIGIHFDGTHWSQVWVDPQVSALKGVHVASSVDAWAIEENYPSVRVNHWDGQQWSAMPNLPMGLGPAAVWGDAANDVWVSGQVLIGCTEGFCPKQTMFHWSGDAWTEASLPPNVTFMQPFSRNATERLWVARTDGLVNWTGAAWSTPIPLPGASEQLQIDALYATPANELWASAIDLNDTATMRVFSWDGTVWNKRPTAITIGSIWASSAKDVWALWPGEATYDPPLIMAHHD